MYPRLRFYLLLLIGFPLAFGLAILLNNQISILITVIYDLVILVLTILDAIAVNRNKVEIVRKPLPRLA